LGQVEILEDATKSREPATKLFFEPIQDHLAQNFLTLSDVF